MTDRCVQCSVFRTVYRHQNCSTNWTPLNAASHRSVKLQRFEWLVAGLSPLRSGLDTGPAHVRIVMDSGIETGFSPTTAGFPCQNHSTNALHSPSHTRFSYQEDKRAKLGSLPKSNVLSAIVELWITNPHLVFTGLRWFLK
jgi:hypothetical protein